MMRASLVTQDAALHALRDEWLGLWRRLPSAPPFQSPAWLLPWWQVFGNGQPHLAVLRDGDGALCGLLPLYAEQGRLRPIGIGITDYLDVLLAPGAPPAAVDMMLAATLQQADACDLPDLQADAMLRQLRAPLGWRVEAVEGPDCPVLPLGGTNTIIPARQRRKWRMAHHRADRSGCEWSACAAEGEAALALWPELLRLHRAAWASRGQPEGVLGDAQVQRFHQIAMPQLAALGLLRLYALRYGQQVVAACYTLKAGQGRLLCYISGFDPAHGFTSPGTILLGHIITQAAAEGWREVHFLRGGEAYKYAWGARPNPSAVRRLLRA